MSYDDAILLAAYEAVAGKDTFDNLCMCGGFAHTMNGRPESQPHMHWCPQFAEYATWWKARQMVAEHQQVNAQ